MDVRKSILAEALADSPNSSNEPLLNSFMKHEPNLAADPVRGGMNRHQSPREDRNGIKINNVRERLPNG